MIALLTGAGAGAGLMYLLDPDRGRRRRALVRDQAMHAARRSRSAFDAASRDLGNRVRGSVAELKGRLKEREVDDDQLLARVRSRIGSVVGHARPLEVLVEGGHVTLRGPVLARDVSRLIRRVRAVPGVKAVDNQLDVHGESDNVPGLQGVARTPRGGEVFELWQENWAPGVRLVTGSIGALLAGIGLTSRGLPGGAAALAGMALLTRAALNIPLTGLRRSGASSRQQPPAA